ncbi:HAD family hydrolase [Streptomyces sp. ODS28]|uniref:HAD family hydrolase n=1 Tax=Streptomyces sp. ODS28 TaxID=3136688 RepID=UPI0031EF4134
MDGRVTHVIFDWAGTLTPWHTVDVPGIWRETAGVIAPGNAEELGARLHAAERELAAKCRETHCSATLDEVFAAAGVVPGEEALAAYRRAWDAHTHLDPDGETVLRGLRERGLGVGVLSNTLWSEHWHSEIFERDGVLGLIDASVYSSEVAWTKPHPEIFRLAMDRVGAQTPATCAYVGDRLFEDVYGARRAGMRTVWVPHSAIPEEERGEEAEPDATVHALKDLLDVVDGWLEPAAGTARGAVPRQPARRTVNAEVVPEMGRTPPAAFACAV